MLVKEILEIKGTKLINGSPKNKIDTFTISTNELKGKTMFFPLKGHTDGHNYILNGIKNKLTGFFTEKGHDDIIEKAIKQNNKIIIIEVEDCQETLIELAKLVRNKLNIPVIALTGSYGKTSQREMIHSVLKTKYKVLVTPKNYNNNIGMPLTLVNYNNEDIILLELGSNHMGEIKALKEICKPTITLITNIGTAHIGNFKSIKNTTKEKSSIILGSKYFFQNKDDNFIKKIKAKNTKVIPYSIEETTNIIKGKKNRYTYTVNGKKYKITINSDLEYLINYSLCALKIGILLDIDMSSIIKGIAEFTPAPSRMEKKQIGKNFIIDDCYNASYETMISGLDYFARQRCTNKIVILGDILELGKQTQKIHKEIAKKIEKNKYNFKKIYLVGPQMENVYKYLQKKDFKNIYYYTSVDKINKKDLKNKNIYLKASHGIGLSKLIDNIL